MWSGIPGSFVCRQPTRRKLCSLVNAEICPVSRFWQTSGEKTSPSCVIPPGPARLIVARPSTTVSGTAWGSARGRHREGARMPRFPTLTFRRNPSASGVASLAGRDLPEHIRLALPRRFEAIAEALWEEAVSPADVIGACTVVGRDVARDGAALGEALSGLRTTYHLVRGV